MARNKARRHPLKGNAPVSPFTFSLCRFSPAALQDIRGALFTSQRARIVEKPRPPPSHFPLRAKPASGELRWASSSTSDKGTDGAGTFNTQGKSLRGGIRRRQQCQSTARLFVVPSCTQIWRLSLFELSRSNIVHPHAALRLSNNPPLHEGVLLQQRGEGTSHSLDSAPVVGGGTVESVFAVDNNSTFVCDGSGREKINKRYGNMISHDRKLKWSRNRQRHKRKKRLTKRLLREKCLGVHRCMKLYIKGETRTAPVLE
ncbi:hypothetical protein HPB50_025816 [Hyalomma asiaticum]|uniref:Uncharacterized protein n=1 Tax=Hyalomma asiaticum TaxID=266040 RepID=A0ACB7SRA3_HYAAI|nr:hypothetical protein HPB50_025816 [Hyalomma asiaticum]